MQAGNWFSALAQIAQGLEHVPVVGGRQGKCHQPDNRVTLVTEPVGKGATDSGGQVTQDRVGKRRLMQRTLQEGESDETKQGHGQPVMDRLHGVDMTQGGALGKLWLVGLASPLLLGLLTACGGPEPVGQVVAVVGDEAVTFRELEQLRRSGAESQQETLRQAVGRKILVAEAENRALDRDGEYHFALRAAREDLLVEALQRRLESNVEVTSEDVEARLRALPWRYAGRFRLGLVSDRGEQGRTAWLDSFAYHTEPPAEVVRARVGTVIDIAGEPWQVSARLAPARPIEELRTLAARDLRSEAAERQMRQMVASAEQSGSVRYQTGFGPAGGD